MAENLGGGKQTAGADIPALPDVPRNSQGFPNGNPTGDGPAVDLATFDGFPVSPAVARARQGAPAAQGRGSGK
jgi:hypothetical protein